jgi:hypothetical protein
LLKRTAASIGRRPARVPPTWRAWAIVRFEGEARS